MTATATVSAIVAQGAQSMGAMVTSGGGAGDDPLPALEGTLLKLSVKGLIRIWKKRVFVVRKGKLYYYRKSER